MMKSPYIILVLFKKTKVHCQSIANQFTFQFCTGQKKQDRTNETILKSHRAAHLDFVGNTSFLLVCMHFIHFQPPHVRNKWAKL